MTESSGPRGDRQPYGTVSGLILLAIEAGEVTGGAIRQWIAAETRGGYTPGAGSLYPRLSSLELRGQVSVNTDTHPRRFALTKAGLADLKAHRETYLKHLRDLRGLA